MFETKETMLQALGIEVKEATPELVVATMPVDHRTVQPMGLLHGGASATLIETACSVGAFVHAQQSGMHAVGVEISVNHIRAKRSGLVTCRATPLRAGKQMHVWNAEVRDEEQQLIAVGRVTLMLVPPKI